MGIFTKQSKEKDLETKSERFVRVASRRVQEILHKMKLLGNCANKNNYSYTDNQITKIFRAVDEEWKKVKHEFNKNKSGEDKFKL